MSKINEYPQAVTINNNDLFVIDQESGGDHATKSASVSQIADKATSGVQTQIGSLSQLTTTDKSSLVGAVNEVCNYGGLHNTAQTALDLNDLKTNDTANKAYHINMAYCSNAPTNSGTCLLEVIKPASNGAMVLQRTTNYGSLGQTHIRFYLNSTWTNWVQTSS